MITLSDNLLSKLNLKEFYVLIVFIFLDLSASSMLINQQIRSVNIIK